MENGEEKTQEEKDLESSKKAAKVGAKAAATYYAGPVGGAAVDALAKTKLGDKALTQAANKANKNPFTKKALRKADEKGITDKADKAVDQYAKAGGGGKAGTGRNPSAGGKPSTTSKPSGGGRGNNAPSKPPSTGRQKGNPKSTDTSTSAKTDSALSKSKSNSKSSDDDTVKKIGKSIWKILPLKVKIFIISTVLLLLSLLLFLVLLTLLMNKYAEKSGYTSMQVLNISAGIKDDNGISYATGGLYENAIVNVLDTQGNVIAHPSSLEDYVIGVAYAEIGITANGEKWGSCWTTTNSEQCDEMIKAQMIAIKTYTLARGRYTKNAQTVNIKSSSMDQNWCDINSGCDRGEPSNGEFLTVRPHTGGTCTISGKSSTNSPNECWKTALSEDSIKKYRELYSEVQPYILIREGLTSPPDNFSSQDESGYTHSTQQLMATYASQNYTFDKILAEIYDGDPRSKFTLVRTVSNSNTATNKYGTINVPGTFETILIDNNNQIYKARIGSCPGYRKFTNSPFHSGIDLSCTGGECGVNSLNNPMITAVAGGKVSLVNNSSCGTGVSITANIDGYEWKYNYCHMQENSRLVNNGTTVSAGQKLGRMGSTGNSTGPHLHFGVRRNGTLVDICSIFLNNYQTDKCTNEDVRYDCDNSEMNANQQKDCHAMFSLS